MGSTARVGDVVSTVVLTLVVVGGSIAVAAKLAASGELKPATVHPAPHRARASGPSRRERRQVARRAAATPEGVAVVDLVAPRPGLLTRFRAGLTLLVIIAAIGGAIAVGLLVGAEAAGQLLEDAVK
jgi:hypothetical protein